MYEPGKRAVRTALVVLALLMAAVAEPATARVSRPTLRHPTTNVPIARQTQLEATVAPSAAEWTMHRGSEVGAALGVAGARTVEMVRGTGGGRSPQSLTVRGVPVKPTATADFGLQSFDVFTPNARIVAMANGVEVPLAKPALALYQGPSLDGRGYMFLAVDGARYQSTITYDGETSFVMPWGSGSSRHVMARNAELPRFPVDELCAVDKLPENREYLSRWREPEGLAKVTTLREADLMIDVNNSLFASAFGSNAATATTYTMALIGAVSSIYQRDANISVRISTLTVWITPDPFVGSDTGMQLDLYRNWVNANRPGIGRDLAHLLGNGNVTNFGGVAYLGVLCNAEYGYSVSNIYANPAFPYPGYHWDVNVVAHEMGHNFGSPHTHCFFPPIDMCYNEDTACYTGPVVVTTGTIMSYCHLTAGGIALAFSPREAEVLRAGADGAACFTTVTDTAWDTVGVHVGSFSSFFLKNSHAPGDADVTVNFGPAGAGWTPITGDWNGDGIDTPGLYVPADGTFLLRNSLSPGPAEIVFGFGPGGVGVAPIIGDWDADGVDTVGIYITAMGTFFLRNSLTPGGADRAFGFGPTGVNWLPVAGDWNADGIDTIGLYNPASGAFFLRNFHSPGPADALFSYGPAGLGWVPVAGDWNGDRITTVGLYDPASGTFFLRNSLAPGAADLVFSFGGAGLRPLVGNWDAF